MAKGKEKRRNKSSPEPEADYSGLIEAALDISRKEVEELAKMRAALEAGDDQEALRLARRLCDLSD